MDVLALLARSLLAAEPDSLVLCAIGAAGLLLFGWWATRARPRAGQPAAPPTTSSPPLRTSPRAGSRSWLSGWATPPTPKEVRSGEPD
jgi:hypothetical protein